MNGPDKNVRQFALMGVFAVLFVGTLFFASQVSKRTPVAPTVPQDQARAMTPQCSLNVVFPTNTPTPTVSPTPSVLTPTPTPIVCEQKTDIALVIDRSSTMNQLETDGRKKLEWAKEAAIAVVNHIKNTNTTNIRITVSSFGAQGNDGTGTLGSSYNSALNIGLTNNYDQVIQAIRGIAYIQSGTCIECGLRIANEQLYTSPNHKAVILLSDGKGNHNWDGSTTSTSTTGPQLNAIHQAQLGRTTGISYYAMGYGQRGTSQIDENELIAIAGSVSHYLYKPNAADWTNGFFTILGNICTETPTPTPTPTPRPVCGSTCSVNSDCTSGMVCSNGQCRNPSCTGQANCICTSTSTPTPTVTPTRTPTPTPGICRASFTIGDTAVCWTDQRNAPVTYTVYSLPSTGGPYYMQTDWYIAAPTPGPHHYVVTTEPLVAGRTYTLNQIWPGIPPGETRTVEIHAGINVVDRFGNVLNPACSGGMDYYWTPYVSCPSGTPTITPTKTPTKTPTPTISPTQTPTPTTPYACNSVCTVNSNCPSGMVCSEGTCRNAACTGQTNCICQSTSTPTYTPTKTPTPSYTATRTPTTSPSYTPTATPLLACQKIEAFRGSENITDNLRSVRYGDTITFVGYASSSQQVKSLTFQLKVNGVVISETAVPAVYSNGVWLARYVYTFNTYGRVNISVSGINL